MLLSNRLSDAVVRELVETISPEGANFPRMRVRCSAMSLRDLYDTRFSQHLIVRLRRYLSTLS